MTLGLSCNFSPFKIILPDSAKRSKFECLFTVNTLVDHSKSVWCETMSLARNPALLLSYSSWNAHPSRVWWLPVSQTLGEILHTVHSTQRCKILTCRIRYMARLGRIGYIAGLFLFSCLLFFGAWIGGLRKWRELLAAYTVLCVPEALYWLHL